MMAVGVSSIMVSDSVKKAPLVFSKWPPYPNAKPSSLRQQIFQQLRASGRIPQNMIVKRYPSQSSISFMMRPMKYGQLKKVPIPSSSSYYRPTISTPPRFQRFQTSSPSSNAGEYTFEKPFNNLEYSVCTQIISFFRDYSIIFSIYLILT